MNKNTLNLFVYLIFLFFIILGIFIYDDYNADVIHNLIQGQRKSIKDKSRKGDKSCFILLDDCMYDKKNMRSKSTNICTKANHFAKEIFCVKTM